MVPTLPTGTTGEQKGLTGTLNTFASQLSKNLALAPWQAFTGQIAHSSEFRDTIIYTGAAILVIVALIGIFR